MLNLTSTNKQESQLKALQEKIFAAGNSEQNPELFTKFLRQFYKYIPIDYVDLQNHELFSQFAQQSYRFISQKTNSNDFSLNYEQISNKLTLSVVTLDKPFIVDSIKCLLKKFNLEINFLFHPVIYIKRDLNGKLIDVIEQAENNLTPESIVYIEIYAYIDDAKIQQLAKALKVLLNDVEQTYLAWPNILKALDSLCQKHLSKNTIEFLNWLKDDNFTFLGFIEIELSSQKIVFQAGNQTTLSDAANYLPNFIANAKNHEMVIGNIDKISTVHKNKFVDYLLILDRDVMHIILGLYGANIDHQMAKNIPILSGKLRYLLDNSGFAIAGYNYKQLKIIFESLPKEMLLQLPNDNLLHLCLQILSSMLSKTVKVFIFSDAINTFAHVLVFIARDKLSAEVQQTVHQYLVDKLRSNLASDNLEEINKDFFFIYNVLEYKNVQNINTQEIEQDLIKITTSWRDDLKNHLIDSHGIIEGGATFSQFATSFPKDYQHKFNARQAMLDISYIKLAATSNKPVFRLIQDADICTLVIFNPHEKFNLSALLPILESLGFSLIQEQSFALSNLDMWINRFSLALKAPHKDATLDIANIQNMIELMVVGQTTIDKLCELASLANMSAREIMILRALTSYIQQTGFVYDKNYVKKTLVKHYEVSKKIAQLFQARFEPSKLEHLQQQNIITSINLYLESVKNAAEDKILKYFVSCLNAIVRTNAYQQSEFGDKPYISFKFDSSKVPNLPLPVPYAEIYVYAKEFEGIHLRNGKVSRGGLRWSDRGQDYRTEVLGLMKAQTTKNSVIVPTGSKGAFFIKNQEQIAPEKLAQHAIACYKNFLRGLLDLTDNLVNKQICTPNDLVIYDQADPYLVVAADKGTASFSDYANQIASEYNFWLGDAFASGGSAGYDHKKLGITAKGAWISVLDHLQNCHVPLKNARFIGIGDMSGDVFGNGMLLSDQIHLIAAFDHRHIFIDPNPVDAIASFNERKRLFFLPGSKWLDYNSDLISQGGGVFERSAKNITLSQQIQDLFNIKQNLVTPEELIKLILTLDVDVIWNGGIGTYVKASSQSHEEIGDKTNDYVRVNAKDLRAKIVAEGGNLGFSQLARIEFAIGNGAINTDFIDNSAGVDCSDHEVNIKICLAKSLESGKIDIDSRNQLMSKMSDEVAHLVLLDNIAQTQAISIYTKSSLFSIELFSQLIDFLETEGILNREVEFLPSKDELTRRIRANLNLTRPEISVLLSYSKMFVYNKLIECDILSDPYFIEKILPSYFPTLMQQDFKQEIKDHQLAKEIVATMATNKVINSLSGPLFISIMQEYDASVLKIVQAYFISNEIFKLDEIWQALDASNTNMEVKICAFTALIKLMRRSISWILTHHDGQELRIKDIAQIYAAPIEQLHEKIDGIISSDIATTITNTKSFYLDNNLQDQLATIIAKLEYATCAFDIISVSNKLELEQMQIAKLYFHIGAKLKLNILRAKCDEIINTDTYLSKLSAQSIKGELWKKQRMLSGKLAQLISRNPDDAVLWYKTNHKKIRAILEFTKNFILDKPADINLLVLANHKIENLV